MSIERETYLIPKRYQFLSGSWLKVLAMVSMAVDHTARMLLIYYPIFRTPLMVIGHKSISVYFLMRCFGRLAFPIFAFLLVEGFQHTHNRWNYGRNLLLFAIISEVPWDLLHGSYIYVSSQNVFFTLFLGFLALTTVNKWEEQLLNNSQLALKLVLIITIGIFMRCDYGVTGISFILLLYVLRKNRIIQAAIGCAMLPLLRLISGLAFIPINLYNGTRGFIKGPIAKYLFYVFYPAHLLVLYILRHFI